MGPLMSSFDCPLCRSTLTASVGSRGTLSCSRCGGRARSDTPNPHLGADVVAALEGALAASGLAEPPFGRAVKPWQTTVGDRVGSVHDLKIERSEPAAVRIKHSGRYLLAPVGRLAPRCCGDPGDCGCPHG
jgi:hypothetical protein